MDKVYKHKDNEEKIYNLWEKSNSFKENKKGEPYTILMPPPNANSSLHAGHAMYTVDDILVRWKRMQGFSSLWIPGRDHAGFETQFVYEKNLAKEGNSRMDYDRETLYKNIYKFVEDNSGLIFNQMKRLGFSADWDRSVFTLDNNVIDFVYKTFEKMEKEKLVYRDEYIVNFCVHDGTSLAELEVKHIERIDPLYFVKYKLVDSDEFISVATVRPETIFIDTHLAVNPKDKKNKKLIGKKVFNPLTNKEMDIIGDEFADPNFGTGIVKLTPAHDANDYAVAKKHNLPIVSCINTFGKIKDNGGKYAGMKIKVAREEAVKDLKENNLIEKVDETYTHSVLTCYKCGRDLEPMTTPNWFIKVELLKNKVKEVVETEKVKFHPKRFKTHMLNWLEIMHDWPISRQIVWGIRIPVWYSVDENPDLEITFIDKSGNKKFGKISEFKTESLTEIEKGLQSVRASATAKYVLSDKKPKGDYLPETDTFDTWFSSGQWPLVTLKETELKTRFPTDTLGTLSDILKFWVSRMIMFSVYLKKEIPFKNVYLWSMVTDAKGVKMSKSKGNVINPLDLVEKYGADALRMSLMYGTPAGSKVVLSDDKVRAMRNFANKVWNIGRFIELNVKDMKSNTDNKDHELSSELQELIKLTSDDLESFRLNSASERVYDFMWNKLASSYLEENKERITQKDKSAQITLLVTYNTCLKLLHPFMPFVTETIYQELFSKGENDLLINSSWPK